MNMRKLAAGCLALAGTLPLGAAAAPSVFFREPDHNDTISGNLYQSSQCEVGGSGIDRVRFYLDGKLLNTEEHAPWQCNLDTRKFADGSHTLRAVAYDRSGVSRSTQIGVTIKNGTASSSGPAVSWSAPAEGGTMSGNIQQSTSQCQVSGSGIARVVFYMDSTQLNTELSAPYLCNVDTTRFANGSHTLKAVAYNSSGASTTLPRSVNVQNGTST
ncbi:MAG TPA: Ig-like domain-containing protein, partial [Burkholderiales bacterium]